MTNSYDAQGRVATQKDAQGLSSGLQTTFGYVTNGDGTRTTTVTYPATSFDPTWSPQEIDTYDSQGRITRRVTKPTSNAADDATVDYAYDASWNRTGVTDPLGNAPQFCYDVDEGGATIPGNRKLLTRRIDPPAASGGARPVTLYTYDANNNVTKVVPPRGVASSSTTACTTNLSGAINNTYATEMAYDASNRLTSRTQRYTDPTSGQQTAVTTYEYADAANPGLVTKVIPPRGNSGATPDYSYATSYTYFGPGPKAGLLQSVTDPLGNKTTYDYDAYGRKIKTVGPRGNAQGANPAEHTWEYVYDKEDRLRFEKAPPPTSGGAQLVTEYRYDVVGNREVVIDPVGQVTKYLYDERDNVKEVQTSPSSWTDPAITPSPLYTTEYQYDGEGHQTRVIRAKGDAAAEQATDFAYDGLGRLKRETRYPQWPSTTPALMTTYGYDAAGRRTTVTDPLNHSSTTAYDNLGRVTSVTNPLTQTTGFGYDLAGNRISVTNPLSQTTTFTYDEMDRQTGITDALNKTTTSRYDANGNLLSTTDPLGHATTHAYDKADRRTSSSNALSQGTTFGYDVAGNQTSVIDALNRTTTFAYDPPGRMTSVTDALSQVTSYGYDANGNLTRVTDAKSRQWNTTYDRLNRLATRADPLSNTWTHTYDAVGNLTQVQKPDGVVNRFVYDRLGRQTGVDLGNNGTLDVQQAWDDAGRRTGLTDATGATTFGYDNADRLTSVAAPVTGTVGMGYDAAGRRTSLTYPSSRQVSYGYTARGQLETFTDWLGTTTSSYDDAGRRTGISRPNGTSSSLAYDNADRPTGITHSRGGTTLEAISYVVAATGRRASMTDGAGTTTWGYDALDRLTSASYPNGDQVGYGYDQVGNRTSLTVNGVQTTNTYDNADRMTAAGADTFTYDTNGNQLTKTSGGVTTTYGYDALDRLISIAGPATASYGYNGDGLRVSKTVGGSTTSFAWDTLGLPRILAAGDEYVWGEGLLGRIAGATTPTYAHADGLGSVRLLTDGAGTVVGSQQYDAFGAPRAQTGTQLPFSYTGEQVDAESGFVYLRARHYAPTLGASWCVTAWTAIGATL